MSGKDSKQAKETHTQSEKGRERENKRERERENERENSAIKYSMLHSISVMHFQNLT